MLSRRLVNFFKSIDKWLMVAIVLGGSLRFSRLGDYDNTYYTATVGSLLTGFKNFFYASFDPVGVVSVDKPPVAFWMQSFSAWIFGLSAWSVTFPQAIVGILSIGILYYLVKQTFGGLSAVSASLILAVLPASVVIDSRNEPDSILSLTLLLSVAALIKSVKSSSWKWLIIFSILMGIAFNVKMFVAFIPLPVFLTYYVLGSTLPLKQVTIRVVSALAVVLLVAASWITVVSLTPQDSRPYVGSTHDNSIWTLVFEYNGINRFTSFIGPRRQMPVPLNQTDQGNYFGMGQIDQRYGNIVRDQNSNPRILLPVIGQNNQNIMNPAPNILNVGPENTGLIGLLYNPLSNQLGWLLPLGIFSGLIVLSLGLSERVYRDPRNLFEDLRSSQTISQGFLWAGWLFMSTFVFGLANATTTHPYYLVGLAVPLAATIGIAFRILFDNYKSHTVTAWILLIIIFVTAVYQVYSSKSFVQDLVLASLIVVILITATISIVGLWKRISDQPLSIVSIFLMGSSLLLIPLFSSLEAEARVGMPNPGGFSNSNRPGDQKHIYNGPTLVEQGDARIKSFLLEKSQPDKITLAGLNAREVSSYIIEGITAISIGGFSGNDPIFNLEKFEIMSKNDGPLYFLASSSNPINGRRSPNQDTIIEYIRSSWSDISRTLDLPEDTLYANPGLTFFPVRNKGVKNLHRMD
jgi:4-amino-4-deoxy-L-arabinose transferase-like glycosyltransferase